MTKKILVVVAVIVSIVAMANVVLAVVPQLISFQGKLYDSQENALTDEYEVTFRIYDVEEGGTALWTETDSVSCDNGLYSFILGLKIQIALDFDGQYWLGIQVTGDDELVPRYRLVTVPTAFRAAIADSAFKASWTNLADVPAGFADGTDDVGAAGGVSQINEGIGINVTNPNGPTATVAADIGTAANQVAAGNHNHDNDYASLDHNHDGDYSPTGHHHDTQYVNEGQPNSVNSGMIVNGTIQQEDLSFNPVGDNDWTIAGSNIYRETGNVGIGTTSPEFPLTAVEDSGDPVVMVTNNGYGHGVWGKNADNFGSGVYGEGAGHEGEGVYGKHSDGNYGFLGDNEYGVYGENVSGGSGVNGKSGSGTGVSGGSSSGTGIFGFSTSGVGVYGYHLSSFNKGWLGGSDYGVKGTSTSGWAGYFSGKVFMNGNVGIGTESPTNILELSSTDPKLYFNRESSTSNLSGLYWRSNGDNFEGAFVRNNGTGDMELYTNISGGTPRMIVTNAGDVGIGTVSPSYELSVIGDIGYTGNIYDVSDIRLKENITPLKNAVDKVSSINSIYFNNKGEPPENREVGVIAQEVEKVLPEVVSEDAEGFKSVDYTKLTPLLIEAVKELKLENEELRQQIEELRQLIKE